MKLELPEDRSSMGVGSAGGRGGEGSKEGIKQEKEFRQANRVEQ